ncbi:TIR domain-containing protein [Nostoc sp. PA-18-2419]|uniref:TIR domain-containing protein n=1 Tax=Nostoc sp. PA-18-2419 TaxID=2575443 RepID=UPI0011097998|nr:TIR domain-containing protein [Nostoc sp. PA-18-2419]
MNSRSFSGVVDEALKVFFCYSRKDEKLRDELVSHLAHLIKSRYITIWYDRLIEPGLNWQNEIEDQLRTADIVLLLVSADFLASNYCYNIEMSLALDRHNRGEVCVIPVILRHCDWKYQPLSNLQALPRNGKPVICKDCLKDDSLTDVAKGIRRVVEGLHNKRQPVLPIPNENPDRVVPPSEPSWLNKITRRVKILLFRRRYRFGRQVGLTIISLLVILLIASPLISELFFFFLRPNSQPTIQVEKFISFGEKSLLDPGQVKPAKAKYDYAKESGMGEFKKEHYKKAVEIFNKIREDAKSVVERSRNDASATNTEKNAALEVLKDPEILIFGNNAQARQNHINRPESALYTIAVAAPTKKYAGSQILLGVAQAQDEVVNVPENSKLNLQVLIADDGNDKSQAENIANEIANNQKDVIAVVGHYASSSTCLALQQYSQGNLAVISPGSTMFDIRSECKDNNKVFFRTVSSTKVEAESLVNYLLTKKPNPKVVVFDNPEEKFSKSLFEQFKNALEKDNKGSVIDELSLWAQDFSLSQYSKEIGEANAVAVFPDGQTVGSNKSFSRAIDVIKATDANKLILGANSLYLQETLNKLADLQLNNRLIIAVDWHSKETGADIFAMPAYKYWYGDVNYRTAMAYEATKILVKILESETKNDRSSIKDYLSTFSSESSIVSGLRVSFDENGDRNEKNIRVLVTPIKLNNLEQNNSELKFCIVNSSNC